LPQEDLDMSDTHSMQADLSIVLGSTLQIIPAGNMPTYGKKYQNNSRLVICNLQPTKQDKKADLCIHTYVDDVMRMLMERLELDVPEYDPVFDPVKQVKNKLFPNGMFLDWTQDAELAGDLQKIGERLHEEYLAGKREERKRKNLQKLEDEAVVRSKKMQKRSEEDAFEVKAEESGDDKDDIPLAQRLEMLSGKAKNGQVKPEEHSNGVKTENTTSTAVKNGCRRKCEDSATKEESNGKAEEEVDEAEKVEELLPKRENTMDGIMETDDDGSKESVIEQEQGDICEPDEEELPVL